MKMGMDFSKESNNTSGDKNANTVEQSHGLMKKVTNIG